MKNLHFLTVLTFFLCFNVSAQMWNGVETVLGHEWIEFEQSYYKIKVSEDGVYRMTGSALEQAGVPIGSVPGNQYHIYHMGRKIPIFVSTAGSLSSSDYIEFFGVKNRGEMDRHLFSNPNKQFNPEYSLYTDTSAYFLTWSMTGSNQFQTTVNDLTGFNAPLDYHMHREVFAYTGLVHDQRFQDGISLSTYEASEGFASESQQNSATSVELVNVFDAGPDATASITVSSSKLGSNVIEVFVADQLIKVDTLIGVEMNTYSTQIPVSSSADSLTFFIRDVNSNSRHVVSYATVTYPRTFDMVDADWQSFTIPASSDLTYLEFSNVGTNGDLVSIYDLSNSRRFSATSDQGTVRLALPASLRDVQLIVSIQPSIDEVSPGSEITFRDWSDDNTEFIMISHPALYDPAITGTNNYVEEYRAYRSSSIGGGYAAQYYSILDIYDLFGYGIGKHPQAIRNFMQFAFQNWTSPKALFMLGKGVQYRESRLPAPDLDTYLYIPTFGLPGADNLLVCTHTNELPPIPVGRIAVRSAEEIGNYLDKLKEYESAQNNAQTIEDRAWMHRVMHLGGGIDAIQQAQLENTLNSIGRIIEEGCYGADINTYTKTSTVPVGETKSKLILDDLKDGVSIVNFYGHSSASTLDFQVNTPSDWNNKGRYPIFSAMGCSAGQIHSDFRSLSEIFTFEKDAGTIAFVAGSGSQYTSPLAAWGATWYRSFGDEGYGNRLGDALLKSYTVLNNNSFTFRLLLQQQTLNGDPMIPFYAQAGPDYTIDYESVRFGPDILTTKLDSFDLEFDIINLGKKLNDTTLLVTVVQKFAAGSQEVIFEGPVEVNTFRSRTILRLPVNGGLSSGKNTIYITLDSDNTIEELPNPAAEDNNRLVSSSGKEGIDVFFLDNRMFASHPKPFSIVSEPFVELIGTSNNAFLKGKTYVMEIDTTMNFDSPMRQGEKFRQFGSVVKWRPNLELIPNTVYYWRVSTDSLSAVETYVWDNSSFIYLPNSSPGWNQSHYYQYIQNDFDRIQVNAESRDFEFSDRFKNIWVRNLVQTNVENKPRVFINQIIQGEFFQFWEQEEQGDLFAIVVDDTTGGLMQNPVGGIHGALNPFNSQIRVFAFNTDNPEDRGHLINFLDEVVPSGDFVILYSYQRFDQRDYYPERWDSDINVHGKSIFDVIEAQYPASQIRELATLGSRPYVIYYQKDVGVIEESLGFLEEETISVEFEFPNKNFSGNVFSTMVGPVRAWKNLYLNLTEKNTTADTAFVNIYGVSPNGDRTLLIHNFSESDTTLDWISATQFPHLQLVFHGADKPERTLPQIEYWRITYTPHPDLIINPTYEFEFEKDTLIQGQNLVLNTAIENVGQTGIENTLLTISITDENNQTESEILDVPALEPGESTSINFSCATIDKRGDHTLFIELNPNIKPEDQLENNTGLLDFFVVTDDLNPLLNVTFDGVRIQDGDIVSAHPLIDIIVEDDNLFFPLEDRSNFTVAVKPPAKFDFEEVDLFGSEMTFFPADTSSGENAMRLEYTPTFIEDGIYELQVEAKDAAGNLSGIVSYTVSFEVIQSKRISNFSNFPNPFRTSTRFVYTLTGNEVPAEFLIEVYSASGRLVKEITQREIGPLRVGRHMTDRAWNGTNSHGAPLPSGVYYYRVVAKHADGSDFAKLSFGGNLTNDFGKMLIIR